MKMASSKSGFDMLCVADACFIQRRDTTYDNDVIVLRHVLTSFVYELRAHFYVADSLRKKTGAGNYSGKKA